MVLVAVILMVLVLMMVTNGSSVVLVAVIVQDTRIFINPTWGNSFPCSSLKH